MEKNDNTQSKERLKQESIVPTRVRDRTEGLRPLLGLGLVLGLALGLALGLGLRLGIGLGLVLGLGIAKFGLGLGLGLYRGDVDVKKTIELLEQELKTAKEAGDSSKEKEAYANLFNAYREHGRLEDALELCKQQLNTAKEAKDKTQERRAYANFGNIYRSLDNFQKAIEYHKKELETAKELKDTEGEIDAYGNLGTDHHCIGNFQEAIEWHRRELQKADEACDEARRGEANSHLGTDYYSLNDFIEGIERHKIHLQIVQSRGDKNGEGLANGNIGIGYYRLGEFDQAKVYHYTQLSIASKQGNISEVAKAYLNLGRAYRRLYSFNYAYIYDRKGYHLACQLEDKILHGNALYSIGRDWECTGYLDRAVNNYQLSVKLFNEVRDSLEKKNSWKISFRDSNKKAYIALWRTLLKLQKFKEALHAAEQGRAQALVDQLRSRASGEARDKERHHEDEVPSYLSKEGTQTIFLTIESNKIHFWVLGKENVEFRQMKLDVATVLKRSAECVLASSDHQATVGNKNVSLYNLYKMIIEPIKDLLKGEELLIVPDGQLFLVPYNILQQSENEAKYLFESFRIRIVPSLTSLKLISASKNRSRDGVLLVGNPQTYGLEKLQNAEIEVDRIKRLLEKGTQNVVILTKEKATKEKVLEQMKSVALIHIASHANEESGEITLSGEGQDHVLTMSDVQAVKLQARLVVLSCCNTGRGKVTADGVVGIARAFLAAGASCVLVSLCEIRDMITMNFMERFYEYLLGRESQGRPTEALKMTLCYIKSSEPSSTVKYCAPFVLIGDDVPVKFEETATPEIMESPNTSRSFGDRLGNKEETKALIRRSTTPR